MAKNLKQALEGALARVGGLDHDALVRRRIDRLMAYGAFDEVAA
jgi:acetyl-CoA carboxylase alpha subunit